MPIITAITPTPYAWLDVGILIIFSIPPSSYKVCLEFLRLGFLEIL
jgi:hypothetical protein